MSTQTLTQRVARLALLLAMAPAAVAEAQEGGGEGGAAQLVLERGSRLWLEGSSNVHDWTCIAGRIDARIQVDLVAPGTVAPAPRQITGVVVQVPVDQLGCGNGKMDANLRRALKAAEHPLIEFRMTEAKVAQAAAGGVTALVTGELTIAGVTRTVEFTAQGSDSAGAGLQISGSEEFRMTDFGVEPPRAMFGALKTADRILVRFQLVTSYKRLAALLDADVQTLVSQVQQRREVPTPRDWRILP